MMDRIALKSSGFPILGVPDAPDLFYKSLKRE